MQIHVDSPSFNQAYNWYRKAQELNSWLPKRFRVIAMGLGEKGHYVENIHRRIYTFPSIELNEFKLELKRAALARKLMFLRDKRRKVGNW